MRRMLSSPKIFCLQHSSLFESYGGANPTILDANGCASIWIGGAQYKFVIKDSNDSVIQTIDEVDGNLSNGSNGTDGRSLRYGTAAPSSGDGNDGDFYIRTTTNFVYGPKASGTWPSGTSLIGPTGATPVISGTSTSSLSIATGSKSFTTQSGIAWTVGQRIRAASDDGTKIMDGEIISYSGTSLVLDVDYIESSGTHAVWNLSIIGERGATGATGTNGTNGTNGANGAAKQELLTGTYAAGNTTYTLTQTPTAAAELLAFLGVSPQIQGTDYSLSGVTVTFTGVDTTANQLLAFYRY